MTKSILLGALFLSTTASAGIYTGNPDLTFKVDRPQHDLKSAIVEVESVRVYACDGKPTDYVVDQTVDLVVGLTLTINGGDLCSAEMVFASEMYTYGNKFVVASAEASITVDLDQLSGTVIPVQLVAGFMPFPESGPMLTPSI